MEPLEELQEIAFRRGVGVSRRNALKSKEFQEFCQANMPGKSISDRETRLQLEYLGGQLADRAFKNLPVRFQRAAHNWKYLSAKEQRATLKDLVDALGISEWYDKRGIEFSAMDGSIFPNEAKTWTRGKVPPNCLGMVQMLVGFARATGDKHLVATPLIPADYFSARSKIFGVQRLIECLEPHSDLPSVRVELRFLKRQLAAWYGILSTFDSRNEQAHHALLLRGKGRVWYYIDPYFCTFVAIPAQSDPEGWAALNSLRRRSKWRTHGLYHGVESFREVLSIQSGAAFICRGLEVVVQCIRTPHDAQAILDSAKGSTWAFEPAPAPLRRTRELRAHYAQGLYFASLVLEEFTNMSRQMPPAVETGASELAITAFVMNHIAASRGIADAAIVQAFSSQYIVKDQHAMGAELSKECLWYEKMPSWTILPILRGRIESMKTPERK